MLTLDLTHTLWDVIEFKVIVLLVTLALAIWLGNKLHNRNKNE